MPPTPEPTAAAALLAAWRAAQAELVELERRLVDAMVEYAETRGEPPRTLIIDTERKRDDVRRLFDLAVEALDAQSLDRTGHTDFGNL